MSILLNRITHAVRGVARLDDLDRERGAGAFVRLSAVAGVS
jgi:hypothetical protein